MCDRCTHFTWFQIPVQSDESTRSYSLCCKTWSSCQATQADCVVASMHAGASICIIRAAKMLLRVWQACMPMYACCTLQKVKICSVASLHDTLMCESCIMVASVHTAHVSGLVMPCCCTSQQIRQIQHAGPWFALVAQMHFRVPISTGQSRAFT